QAGRGLCHYRTPEGPALWGMLDDQTQMVAALLDAFQVTGQARHLETARRLADEMIANHTDPEEGGFYDIADFVKDREGALRYRAKELPANAEAARALLILAELTGESDYRDVAEDALRLFTALYREHGLFAADYARSVDLALRPPATVTVIGPAGEEASRMRRTALATGLPGILIDSFDPEHPRPGFQLDTEGMELPQATVCRAGTCLRSAHSAEELESAIRSVFSSVSEEAS
ncbi:MAG: AGE family epimerase/isomerase, partial [Candidatus Geothermincolia bacterium]